MQMLQIGPVWRDYLLFFITHLRHIHTSTHNQYMQKTLKYWFVPSDITGADFTTSHFERRLNRRNMQHMSQRAPKEGGTGTFAFQELLYCVTSTPLSGAVPNRKERSSRTKCCSKPVQSRLGAQKN